MNSINTSALISKTPLKSALNGLDLTPDNVGLDRAKPLDLFNGHLPTQYYTPVTRGLGADPLNWFMPVTDYDPSKALHLVAKIQSFKSGGYEVTLSSQDLNNLARRMDAPKTGVRVQGEQSENDVISSVNRSKKKIRYLIKSMGCDRLLTLTKRENNPDDYWTPKDWAVAWDRFNKLCKRAGIQLQYVSVLERHKKGNYHLHAAIVGKISVNTIRSIWLVITGGKGSGNVDIARRSNCSDHKRRAGLARYVSKYVSKQIGQTEFNKKRYWSSRHDLPAPRRYIMTNDDAMQCLKDLCGMLSLDSNIVIDKAFIFSGFSGAWFSFDDSFCLPPPF